MQNLNPIKIFALLLLVFSVHAHADESISILINELHGDGVDLNNGAINERPSSFVGPLIINVSGNRASLNTGTITLTGGILHTVGAQLTFIFEAEMAVWTLTCYPKINFAFVSVHSDASAYGGAKMLSYHGVCSVKET